jgi:triosephosphate isomerase (TIM)
MAAEEQGAHTGEISVLMLKDLGVQVVILGHSERRHTYGEGDALINRKVRLALRHGLEIILCVGETLDEREAGRAVAVCDEQARKGLEGVSAADMGRVTIAYEPVWAIGTGKNATPEDAEAIHVEIRKTLAGLYTAEIARATTIQYGGSVKSDNVKSLMDMPNIDGALVGGASLKTETFLPIALF